MKSKLTFKSVFIFIDKKLFHKRQIKEIKKKDPTYYILSNRLSSINRKITLDMMNLPIETFKIRCKNMFLCNPV